MSFLKRKYPFQERGPWIRDCALYSVIVFAILYFLQPFGFSGYSGSKLLASFLFGAVTFLCCLVYETAVSRPLQRRVKPWRVWHQALAVLGLELFHRPYYHGPFHGSFLLPGPAPAAGQFA